ncbi:DegT/DnrJ/EryC1/StrS aminotransferase family protein [Diaminobutyricibacter tongyongensis]|uniref:DegT/DnrJ/EryC1/StrS aminotransferase family protein n=1 Tax=Leifsonia tongyongensis TaxID=1268043 RepID=A0A6L9XVK2_9MICO|nr:DegT/DnrJ/EryC1/StrS aminotransferase family protein [Diaminobutyricibacter tongyongensis]
MRPIVTKTARDQDTGRRPSLFYGSAREGMRDFLAHTLASPDDGVLLPAFIGLSPREGSGVLDPVLSVGAQAGFYNLNPDLTVDVDDLERRLSTDSYRVVVIIHYYGRTEPRLAAIRTLADATGALVVEDLAHGFFTALSGGTAGRHGHLNLFSLHKMFPFDDGGMVQYATTDLLRGQAQTRPELAQRILDYDWATIARARRENFLVLSERLAALPECGRDFDFLWEHLGDDDVPQTLPVRILSDRRDAIYAGMNADGYGMVSLYHTLIEQVRGRFEVLEELSRHIINFPVHQDVRVADVDGMLESFRRHLAMGDQS